MCTFCEVLNHNNCAAHNPSHTVHGYSEKYKAALVSVSYRHNERTGEYTEGEFPLNYCPECGKKINIE